MKIYISGPVRGKVDYAEDFFESEVEAKMNMLCKPGRIVQIRTKEITGGRNFIIRWKKWTVIKRYKHHVLMSCRGYRESFTNTDIKEMIRKEDIR